jgi:hypothetical protein
LKIVKNLNGDRLELVSSLAIDFNSVPKPKQYLVKGLQISKDKIALFVADGSVLVFRTDMNYHLKSCSSLIDPLEFEPSLVALF